LFSLLFTAPKARLYSSRSERLYAIHASFLNAPYEYLQRRITPPALFRRGRIGDNRQVMQALEAFAA
jgi:hypothetical protein